MLKIYAILTFNLYCAILKNQHRPLTFYQKTEENKTMINVLIAGFGPYKSPSKDKIVEHNITEKIINYLSGGCDIFNKVNKNIAQIYYLVLPVEWRKSRKMLLNTIRSVKPDIILGLGHAPSANVFHLESTLSNFITFRDRVGKTPPRPYITRDGPDKYKVNVPINQLRTILRKSGVPAKKTDDIGDLTYLCGYIAYLSRYYAEKYCDNTVTMFIHVPPPEKLEFNTTIRGIKLVINFLLNLKIT